MIKGSLQEKNGIYQAVIYVNGKYKWRSTGIKAVRGNKRRAEQRLREIVSEYDANPNMFDKIDFTTYMGEWLDAVKARVDQITYEGYKSYLEKHIKPYFQELNLKLQDVRLSHIEKYYNYKAVSGRLDGKSGGLSYRSIKLHSVVLNLIFEYAMRNKLITENPCKYAQIPNTAKRSEKHVDFYTPKQCQELLDIIKEAPSTKDTPLYDMVYITFMYGLRRSELMGLKWSAIDFDNNKLSICHTVAVNASVVAKDRTKNESSNRTYPLLPEVKKILLKIKEQQSKDKETFGNCYHDDGYVFAKIDGTLYYPAYPTQALTRLFDDNDNLKRIRWHDLRHSTASMLIEKGWSMKDISEWLGHSQINITMDIYGHISLNRKRELANSLNGLLSCS